MARGLYLDNIHSALQVIILGLFLEGNRRDTAWLLLFSVMRERSRQRGPSARALSIPRLCDRSARTWWESDSPLQSSVFFSLVSIC